MAFVVKNDLQSFVDKLKNYKIQNNLINKALNLIGKKMVEIAEWEYADYEHIKFNASIENNHLTFKANGRGIAYIEFGTGLVGEQSGYPKDKLPTQTLIFESPKGEQQITQGWEYYYNNPKTKILGGWFFGSLFTRGQVAGMQMLNIMNETREYIHNYLAKDIREGD